MGTRNGKWDGRGTPPSRSAAVQWLVDEHDFTSDEAEDAIGKGASRTVLGSRARTAANQREARRNGGFKMPSIDATKIPSGGDLLRAVGGIPDALDRLLPGDMPSPQRMSGGSRRTTSQSSPREGTTTLDADGDGAITAADLEAAGGSGAFGEDIFGDIPFPGQGTTRGAPLWPYDVSGLSDDELGGITVDNKSFTDSLLQTIHKQITGQDLPIGRVNARYYAKDALAPLRWSAEQRADLQRLMHGLGLYGDKQIRLGTWTAQDQDVFTAVLEYSNVGGTRWAETLSGWRKAGLPPELADKIKQAQPKRPTIQVTNPMDIRQAAVDVSRELTGEVDRGFAEGSVGGYQGQEIAAQQGVYGDQEAGGGGTVTAAPSMGAYLEDKLRRENPIEVDGYQFLGQFQNFLSMMGVQ